MSATHYAAINSSRTAIYGIGATPEEALIEAVALAETMAPGGYFVPAEFFLHPCTPALAAKVEREGGAISWSELPDGTQCTDEEKA